MFFVAIATDYDNTIAVHGIVDEATREGLEAIKRSGRRTILVTGRELPDVLTIFPQIELFDIVIAENGAVLYDPMTKKEEPLSPPPPDEFVAQLKASGIKPLSVGRSIVATWEPNETVVLGVIRELGLDLQIIFNKGAVMVLPPGINKASGLAAALKRLGLSPHNVVGVGDAENDHAFLSYCGCGVAVQNALPAVKEKVDFVTQGAIGEGVRELIRLLDETDLKDISIKAPRLLPRIGACQDGSGLRLDPRDGPLLVAGSSGGGKSTVVTSFLEQMHKLAFQFCVIDPEGDYTDLDSAIVIGGPGQEPRSEEVIDLLSRPDVSVVVNLLGIKVTERPRFFAKLLPELASLRAKFGRPHWIVVDEAHHMLPAEWDPAPITLPSEMPATILVTVHPEALAADVVKAVDSMIGVGKAPREAIARFCEARAEKAPPELEIDREAGDAYYWQRGKAQVIRIEQPKGERRRHLRKYAEGQLGEDRSFYFRGPEGKLKLRAHNLIMFLQMAEGVDDATWMHHLREGDYGRWFEEAIKDPEMAEEAAQVEANKGIDAATSRELIAQMVQRRYTAPAKG